MMIEVGVRDHGERKPRRFELEPVHGGEDDLLGRFRNARVHEDDLVADQEVLEEIAAAKERLNLVDVLVELHHALHGWRVHGGLVHQGKSEVKSKRGEGMTSP